MGDENNEMDSYVVPVNVVLDKVEPVRAGSQHYQVQVTLLIGDVSIRVRGIGVVQDAATGRWSARSPMY